MKNSEGLGHNQLQSKCFLWFYNEHPDLRPLLFAVNNNLTSQDVDARAKMSQLKSLGVQSGTTDLIFYYKGVLYAMDIKMPDDKFKPSQIEFVKAVSANGGQGIEIRTFEQFKSLIYDILKD